MERKGEKDKGYKWSEFVGHSGIHINNLKPDNWSDPHMSAEGRPMWPRSNYDRDVNKMEEKGWSRIMHQKDKMTIFPLYLHMFPCDRCTIYKRTQY